MLKRVIGSCLALAMLFAYSATGVSALGEENSFMIDRLQTEYRDCPIGIDTEKPRFSWQMKSSASAQSQKNYRLTVATDEKKLAAGEYDCWDSGTVESGVSVGVVYGGKALQAQTRYYWQVTVTDQNGRTATSAPSYFETGLMNGGFSEAQWITAPVAELPGFSDTTFTLETEVKIQSAAAGIIFGAQNNANFFMWQLLLPGNSYSGSGIGLRPHRWVDGSTQYPAPGGWNGVDVTAKTGVSAEDIKNGFVKLRLEVREGTVQTYVNDALVCTHTFPPFALDCFGFRESGEQAAFDCVTVRNAEGNVIFSADFSDGTNPFDGGTVTDGALSVKSNVFCVNKTTEQEQENPDNRPKNGATNKINEPAPMFRKEFTLEKEIASARLYLTSAGNHEAYLNGQKVSETYFDPGRTNYSHTLQYQTYDVTSMLKKGANAFGAYVGHGWFQTKWNNFGSYFGLLMKLDVTYADGTKTTVVSDGTFKTYSDGPIRYEDLMNGETYDANYEVEGWSEAGLDDRAWEYAVCRTAQAMRVAATPTASAEQPVTAGVKLTPVAVEKVADNTFVYDFGQNMAGIPYLKIRGEKGQKIKLTYGEVTNGNLVSWQDNGVPGSVYRGNLTDAQATDFYVCKGDPDGEIFHPTMTYHGFRYMQVEAVNFPLEEVGSLLVDVKGYVLYNDMERTGWFECSDSDVNQLFSNSYWSNIDNFLAIPTDCPQRGERTGWTGDAQIYARTATYNLNSFAFLEKYIRDVRADRDANGNYPEVAPAPTWRGTDTAAGWGDVAVVIPWTLYLAYGDTRVLEENYTGMCAWVDHLVAASDHYLRPDKSQYGDWLAQETTPPRVTNNAYAAYAAQLMTKTAQVLHKTEDAAHYAEVAEGFRKAWVDNCTDGAGKTLCETQTSYVLGLQFSLFDEKDRETAANRLVELIEQNGNRLKTGFLGVNFLNPSLTDSGHSDTAYTLLEQRAFPSWLYPVTLGATTIFENWGGMTQNDEGKTAISNSLNHYCYGSVSEWLYRYVLGIDADEEQPGYKHILLHPTPDGTLTYARGRFDSQYGTIRSGWEYKGSDCVYTFEIPANTTATVTLQKEKGKTVLTDSSAVMISETEKEAVYAVSSGSHSFTVKNARGGLTESITVRGANIRLGTNPGLRFAATVEKNEWYDAYYGEEIYAYADSNNLRFGTIVAPSELLENTDLITAYLGGNPVVLDIPAKKIYAQDAETLTFTGVLTQIPRKTSTYTMKLTAAFYICTRENESAQWEYRFSETLERSYFECAQAALKTYEAVENPTQEQQKVLLQLRELVAAVDNDDSLWLGGEENRWY